MPIQTVKVNSRKFDLSISRTWTGELIETSGSLLVVLGRFDSEVVHPELGHIRKGTSSYEYYWLDRWYNIFRFHEPDGTLRNYYCNITMPPTLEMGVLDYVDLDIDVVVWPESNYKILDKCEFEENASKYMYPEAIRTNVDNALSELLEMIQINDLPPV